MEMRLWRYVCWVVVRSDRSLYSMRSVILSQWRERKTWVIWQDLGAFMTVWAREFWICWRRILRLSEFIVDRITVIEVGMNDWGSNGTGSWRIKVRPDTPKLTNVIVTGFGESCNLVRERRCSSKMKPRFRAEWEVSSEELCILASCFLSPMSKLEFSLRGVKG